MAAKHQSSPTAVTPTSPSVSAGAIMQNKANLPSRARSVPVGAWRGRERPWRTRQGQDGLATETPHGVTTNRVCRAKQSQFPGNRQQGTTGVVMRNKANPQTACCAKQSQFPEPVGRGRMTDYAKQTQFSGPVRSERRAPLCKTKPTRRRPGEG